MLINISKLNFKMNCTSAEGLRSMVLTSDQYNFTASKIPFRSEVIVDYLFTIVIIHLLYNLPIWSVCGVGYVFSVTHMY